MNDVALLLIVLIKLKPSGFSSQISLFESINTFSDCGGFIEKYSLI